MIHPLNNHCLIEVLDEYAGIVRDKQNENVQKGVLRDFKLVKDHLTTSTGYFMDPGEYHTNFTGMLGKTVYWQEYADAGSKFTVDGKSYVLVPFYRLIGFEE